MKNLTTLALLLAFASFSQAEEVEVFTCDTKSHRIEWGESGVEETTTYLSFHRVGKLVGKLDTGKVSLSQFAAAASAYVRSSDPFLADPFFGPGVNYIVKDTKGEHFILFFEYVEGHRNFNGFRLAINKALPIDPELGVYEGRPYAGTSFDKSVLAQLKDLTQKKTAEQAGTGQPATQSRQAKE